MKLASITLFLILPLQLFAQLFSAVVVNSATKLPITEALIVYPGSARYTDDKGRFSISSIHKGDTAVISHDGYKSYKLAFSSMLPDTIRLQPLSVVLNEVTVKATRNYAADSISNRKAFARVFNYRGSTVSDMFIPRASTKYIPYNYANTFNNTTALASINLLQVASLLSSKKQNTTHLQKVLLKNEETDYVDHLFTKQRITFLVPLKGDSLQQFMDRYRPTYKNIKKMNEYDLNTYIKSSYSEFRKQPKN